MHVQIAEKCCIWAHIFHTKINTDRINHICQNTSIYVFIFTSRVLDLRPAKAYLLGENSLIIALEKGYKGHRNFAQN